MKYEYIRPELQISNWLVKTGDIKRLHDFFCERLQFKKVEINLETQSGDNRTYEDYPEFEKDVPRLEANKEIVSAIRIIERFVDKDDYLKYKQMWIDISFYPQANTSFHVIAGDRNGKFKDWIAGTYEQMKKLKALFEISDEKFITTLRQEYSPIVFDPKGKIEKKIKDQIGSKEKIALERILARKVKWWERSWVQVVFLMGALAGIVGLLALFKR